MRIEDICSNPPCILEQGQRERYYDQGYLLFPSLVDEQELTRLRKATAEVVERSRTVRHSSQRIDLERGHSAASPRLRRVTFLDDVDPVFWEICSDSVIPDIAADLVGPNVRFRDIMLNFKWEGGGAEVKWHQDLVFYPHTHSGTMQFLVFLEDVSADQGPLQVLPGSHKGRIFEHYDDRRQWTGAIGNADLQSAGLERAIELTGKAGTVSVHHSLTIHGSGRNSSQHGRPALVITYSAADAVPYTAAPYPSSHYGMIVRGIEPGYAHHEELYVPMPPDWSAGYTSIFEHQDDDA